MIGVESSLPASVTRGAQLAHQAFGILIYLIIGDNGASAEGSPDHTAHASKFNGRISWVQIGLGKDAADADHFIDDEERVRVIMARQ